MREYFARGNVPVWVSGRDGIVVTTLRRDGYEVSTTPMVRGTK